MAVSVAVTQATQITYQCWCHVEHLIEDAPTSLRRRLLLSVPVLAYLSPVLESDREFLCSTLVSLCPKTEHTLSSKLHPHLVKKPHLVKPHPHLVKPHLHLVKPHPHPLQNLMKPKPYETPPLTKPSKLYPFMHVAD
jgi:hypothetical protein